ncbi:MAG: 16S rRNA (cytidine(1402)-2'-O)-methyltransferase [Anaerolineales bacterium]
MGTLYLVATPIGNLEDISQRALRVLSEVQLVAAEDTRRTRKLLQHFSIETPTISFHEHNKQGRMDQLLAALQAGDVALVSDAGTPAISDPGRDLVQQAWESGHRLSPIPGPSAPLAALSVAGLAADSFLFLGYLPRKRPDRKELLEARSRDPWTRLAFEVPHRILESMEDMEETLGAEREIVVCRELTKVYEEIVRGSIAEVRGWLKEAEPRGEYTLVIEGAEAEARWDEDTLRAAVKERVAHGDRPSDLARELAELSGWRRRRIYEMTLEEQ